MTATYRQCTVGWPLSKCSNRQYLVIKATPASALLVLSKPRCSQVTYLGTYSTWSIGTRRIYTALQGCKLYACVGAELPQSCNNLISSPYSSHSSTTFDLPHLRLHQQPTFIAQSQPPHRRPNDHTPEIEKLHTESLWPCSARTPSSTGPTIRSLKFPKAHRWPPGTPLQPVSLPWISHDSNEALVGDARLT